MLLLLVVLVGYLADYLFQNVFEGDKAGCASVFVHDDSEMHFVLLELLQQVVEVFAFGHEVGGPDEGLPTEVLRLVKVWKQVFGVEDSFDFVGGAGIDRYARISR